MNIIISCDSFEDLEDGIAHSGHYFEFEDCDEFTEMRCPDCGENIVDEHENHKVVMVSGLAYLTDSLDLNVLAAAVAIDDHAMQLDDVHGRDAVRAWKEDGHPVDHDSHTWIQDFDENFLGVWRSVADYAKSYAEDVCSEQFKDVPKWVVIDWDKTGAELIQGMWAERTVDGRYVMIFGE